MDESGNTGTTVDPEQPVHMLGCLIVAASSVRPFEDAIDQIARKHFPALAGRDAFEFHGADIWGGTGIFKKVDPTARVEALKELAAAAKAHSTAFGYTGVNKAKCYANDHPHRIAF